MSGAPHSAAAEPLFSWVVRESSVDTAGNWELSQRRELVIDAEGYLRLLAAVGAKVTGLLVSLALLSQPDPKSGLRFIEGSQVEIGRMVSGGDNGWSGDRTREALQVLLAAGLLEKVPSRALGRSKGSTAPRWLLSPQLFAVDTFNQKETPHGAPYSKDPSNRDPNDRPRKTPAPKTLAPPSRIGPQDLGPLTAPCPHGMDMNTHSHPWSDDNDAETELLSVAVLRELAQLGWQNPERSVTEHDPALLAAWIVTARAEGRRNPGGFIRTQTRKPGWPFPPPGWILGRDRVEVTADGRLQRTTRPRPETLPTPPLLTVAEIVEILQNAGDLGREVQQRWVQEADAISNMHPPSDRSRTLKEVGTALIKHYHLTPRAEQDIA